VKRVVNLSLFPPMDYIDHLFLSDAYVYLLSSQYPLLTAYRITTRGRVVGSYTVDTGNEGCEGEAEILSTSTVDPSNSRVYITNNCNHSLHVFTVDGHPSVVPFPSAVQAISALAVDHAGVIWFSQDGSSGSGYLYGMDQSTSRVVRTCKLPLSNLGVISLTHDPSDDSILASTNNFVFRYSNAGLLVSTWTLGPRDEWDMEVHQVALDPLHRGQAFVAVNELSNSRGIGAVYIATVNASSGAVLGNLTVAATAWQFLMSGVAASEQELYVADWTLGRVLVYDRSGQREQGAGRRAREKLTTNVA